MECFREFLTSNPLHPGVFPTVRKMEAEVPLPPLMLCAQATFSVPRPHLLLPSRSHPTSFPSVLHSLLPCSEARELHHADGEQNLAAACSKLVMVSKRNHEPADARASGMLPDDEDARWECRWCR